MYERSDTLAELLLHANAQLIEALEDCPDERWTATCDHERWPVGVTAHHVACSTPLALRLVGAFADGAPPPLTTLDELDLLNARHAAEHAGCMRAETIALIRGNAAIAAAALRSLTEAQLDRTARLPFMGFRMSTEEFIENVLLSHPLQHTASIRAAIAGSPFARSR